VKALTRRERIAVALWLVLGLVVWNGVYDMVMARGIREYLFRAALFQAGRGPAMPVAAVMDPVIYEAVWVSTIWACTILFAGMVTLKVRR
jgi:hypothetical protein